MSEYEGKYTALRAREMGQFVSKEMRGYLCQFATMLEAQARPVDEIEEVEQLRNRVDVLEAECDEALQRLESTLALAWRRKERLDAAGEEIGVLKHELAAARAEVVRQKPMIDEVRGLEHDRYELRGRIGAAESEVNRLEGEKGSLGMAFEIEQLREHVAELEGMSDV